MAMKVSKVLFLSCLIIHLQSVIYVSWMVYATEKYEALSWNIAKGLAFLVYPFCGWFAEVVTKPSRMITWSYMMNIVSGMCTIVAGVLQTRNPHSFDTIAMYCTISSICGILTGLAGLGMYEANAIQFGMDQMLEESSQKLSSFIHWYYWYSCLGPLLVYYIQAGGYLYMADCRVNSYGKNILKSADKEFGKVIIVGSSIQVFVNIFGLTLVLWSNRYLFVNQKLTRNSFRTIFKVLKYSFKQKYPERRSAFTYWENDIPSRIDLGKNKYGGPFTFEQVEDVKCFIRLLLLILSLFGYQLLGDGYSLSFYIMNKYNCPSITPLLLLIANPQHVPLLVIIVGIPLLQLIQKYFPKFIPNMLTRLWLGLFLTLLTNTVQVIYTLTLPDVTDHTSCFGPDFDYDLIQKRCIIVNMNVIVNGTCHVMCTNPQPLVHQLQLYIVIVPMLLYGLSCLFTFMTTLEFICAQSPSAYKGLLIGIWYAMLSLKCIVINPLDLLMGTANDNHWSLYHGAKGVGMIASMILFCIVQRYYRYRERNEIVNEQAIIEEQYERELLLNNSDNDDTT